MTQPYTSEPTCPECKQLDMVMKVSEVVDRGVAAIDRQGSISVSADSPEVIMDRASQLQLSLRLAPPPRPVYPDPWNARSIIAALVLFCSAVAFGLVGITIAMLPLLMMAGNRLEREPVGSYPMEPVYIILIAICAAIAVGFALLLAKRIRSMRRAEKARVFEFAADNKAWKAAMVRWSLLYYCCRCDGAFIPGSGTHLVATDEILGFSNGLG